MVGCLTPKAHENPKTTDELQHVLRDFHMKLRWGLWEQAAAYTSGDFRNEFLGRYEELGEDFKIVNLEIKMVTLAEPVSTVDVEQESYSEREMVVQKKRYIESWVFGNGTWQITERIPKEEWRKRQKEAAQTGEEGAADAEEGAANAEEGAADAPTPEPAQTPQEAAPQH